MCRVFQTCQRYRSVASREFTAALRAAAHAIRSSVIIYGPMAYFFGAGGLGGDGPRNWSPTTNLTHKNAACQHATTFITRRIYNSTTMEECKSHNC